MTTLREAAQQALEALEDIADELISPYNDPIGKAILDLRTALAEPEQEPVAWRYQNSLTDTEYLVWNKGIGGRNWTPLYTHPQTDDTALLRQALEALDAYSWEQVVAARTALRERLEGKE